MTLEELADLLRTPLPPPPQLTPEQLERLKASAMSSVGGLAGLLPSLPAGSLPMMPEWLRRYSEERGLLPGLEAGTPRQPSPATEPVNSSYMPLAEIEAAQRRDAAEMAAEQAARRYRDTYNVIGAQGYHAGPGEIYDSTFVGRPGTPTSHTRPRR